MNQNKDRHMLRWGLTLLWLLSSAGAYAFYLHIEAEGWLAISAKLQVLVTLIAAAIALLAAVCIYAWTSKADRLLGGLNKLVGLLAKLRLGLVPLMLALLAVFPFLMQGTAALYLDVTWTRQAIFAWLVVIMAVLVAAMWRKPVLESALIASLSLAVAFHFATYIPHVTSYPFSLWWSETTRFYLGSTFFDQRIYGQNLPWVFRDLTRYLIQAVPFLIEDSPLWVHRLWQAGLRFLIGYLVGFVLSRRLKIGAPLAVALFSAWVGLYLFQGPLFYNLAPIAILVIWLGDPRRFWKTMLVVAAASVYGGLSRINWVPMAGLLAALLYFLEIPLPGKKFKDTLLYLMPPAVWTLAGSLLGLGALQLWQRNSGNPPEIFHSSFTSYLLFDRLFPNPSYAPGIIPATLIVAAPLLICLALCLRGWRERYDPIRVAAIAVILLLLGAGGLLVSIKIGGGTNLHNMDVFLVALLLVAVELIFSRSVDRQGDAVHLRVPVWLGVLIVLIPVGFVVSFTGRDISPPDMAQAQHDLAVLQSYVDEASADGGEVLFVSQRHLLTFGLIENVSLVHAHEKVLLQEMVMSKNYTYLESFGAEMASQRYAMIVIDPLPMYWKDPDKISLAMENNVVQKDLVPLILCAYEEKDALLNGGLEILVPKAEPTCQIP